MWIYLTTHLINKTATIFDIISLDLSTSVQSSTAVTLQDDQASPREPELTPAEVVPVVAPPSLREVQQAVQEASEQVEGRGAEEVLKGLLERVVEAALGQVEAGGEVKADEAAEQETIEVGAERGETESEVMEQAVEVEAEGEDLGAEEAGDTGAEVEQEAAKAHAFQDVAEEENGPVGGEVEIAAGSVEGTAAGVETGGRKAEGVEVVDESPDTRVGHEVVEETADASDETGGYLAVGEAGAEGELSEEKGEIESQEGEETPAVVGGELEQETVVESDPSLVVADAEQIDLGAKEEALEEVTQLDDAEGEAIAPPADSDEMETTQSVVGEPVEDEEEGNVGEDGEGTEAGDEQGHLAVEGGAAEGVEAEGADAGEAEGESVIKDESAAPVDEGVEGEEAQIALETSHGSEKEDQGEKHFQQGKKKKYKKMALKNETPCPPSSSHKQHLKTSKLPQQIFSRSPLLFMSSVSAHPYRLTIWNVEYVKPAHNLGHKNLKTAMVFIF